MKKALSFILAAILILTQLPILASAEAAHAETVTVSISNVANTTTYEVLSLGSDLYFPPELFGEVTNYRYIEGDQKVSYQLGKKIIVIDLATGGMQIPAMNYTGTIDVVSNEDGNYISASSLLPWLNVSCSVTESGALEIIPDGISLWEILDEVETNYNNYLFNLYAEYGDSITSIAGLTAMSMFDTIIHLRWDRLIPVDGTVSGAATGGSYYDYKCYIAALTDFATDDSLTSEAAKNRIDQVVKVNKGLDDLEKALGIDEEKIQYDVDSYLWALGTDAETIDFFYDITETWQSLRQGISDYGKVSKYFDIFSVLKAYELSLKTDSEYRDYINWLSKQDTGNTVFNSALDRTALKLAENEGFLISTYIDWGENILGQLPGNILEGIVNNSLNEDAISTYSTFKNGFFSSLNVYMLAARSVFGTIFGVTDGYKGMSKVTVNEAISDYCWQLQKDLQIEEITAENVTHIRQSVMTALKASKLCYQAMQSTMDSKLINLISGTDNSTLMSYKIDPINERLTDLIASADNTENDSIDGKTEYQFELKSLFECVEHLQPGELTEDVVKLLIEPFEDWVYLQEQSFDLLTDSYKIEMCAIIAFHNDSFIYADDGRLIISKSTISEIMECYFGQACAVTSDKNTDSITTQSNSILYSWGEWGDTEFEYKITSISKLADNTYSATVLYTILIEELGASFEYCTVTYYFDFDYDAEYSYYIADFSLDYQFIGWDYISDVEVERLEAFREDLFTQVVNHYTEVWQPQGTYSCSDYDFEETSSEYIFVLRYSMSDEEAEERIANGGMVPANVYVTTVWVNKLTGEARDEIEDGNWYVNLS